MTEIDEILSEFCESLDDAGEYTDGNHVKSAVDSAFAEAKAQILALIGKRLHEELKALLPEMNVEEYGPWVRDKITARLKTLSDKHSSKEDVNE